MFSVNRITKRFGSATALNDLSFAIHEGEIFGVAGPNGAGKSTLLNVCSGLLKCDGGEILLEDKRMNGLRPHVFCRRGIARTFQIPQIFNSLTIGENIGIGASFGIGGSWTAQRNEQRIADHVLELSGLEQRRDEPSGAVDLLTRKMIMLAAALATEPKLVFMDEPLAGLNTEEIALFTDLIAQLQKTLGISFVIVEHKVRALADLSDRILILHFGELLCLDTPDAVLRDARVREVYLGNSVDA